MKTFSLNLVVIFSVSLLSGCASNQTTHTENNSAFTSPDQAQYHQNTAPINSSYRMIKPAM